MARAGVSQKQAPSYRVAAKGRSAVDWRGMLTVTVAIGAIVAVAFGGGYALRRGPGGLPVVEASTLPLRVKPTDSGGAAVIGSDETANADPNAEGLAPDILRLNVLREKPEQGKPAAQVNTAQKFASLIEHLPPLVASADAATVNLAAAAPPATISAMPAIAAPVSASTVMAEGGISVQLGALASEQGAQAAWADAATKNPDLIGNHGHLLVPGSLAGHQVWRLRIGGFADVADAATFCAKLHARGSECTVAAF